MTESQIIDICAVFSGEVYNGGFLQFFYNDSNACIRHLSQCLAAIGADDVAEIFQSALSVLPTSLPDDLEQRRSFLSETLTPEMVMNLQRCDERFYKLSSQLDTCLDRFIDLHFPDEPISIDRTKPKDYVALYCKLEERTASTWDDLSDPKLRRRHNKAMTEIHTLNMELFSRADKGAPVILKLLQSKNPRVRITAGAYCLQAQIHEDLGKSVLKQIATDPALDKLLQMDARNCIRYCRPYNSQ